MSANKQRILVTGASGFLGRNILQAFANQPHIELVAACQDETRLPDGFTGEVRPGDLRDPAYRQQVVQCIDVICHTGTWASMWNHARQEQANFYLPALDLIEQAIHAGVGRFIMTSSIAINRPRKDGNALHDFARPGHTGFWPHLDRLIDVDNYMQNNAGRGTQMLTMRLGHFIGAGNRLGLVPALVPRLKTWLVPWINKGKSRLPLIADTDLGRSYVAASLAHSLNNYESFNICGQTFPTTREVIEHIAARTGSPRPLFSVPYPIAYLFAWLMEKLFPLMPGKGPFLTRSIVHLAEEWIGETEYAGDKLGYKPTKDWRIALDEALDELETNKYPWPYLAQKQ